MVGQFTIGILGCVWLHWHHDSDAPCSLRTSLGYSHTWATMHSCESVWHYSLSSHFRTLVSTLRIFHLPKSLVLGEYLIFSGNPSDDVVIHWQVFRTGLPVRTSS